MKITFLPKDFLINQIKEYEETLRMDSTILLRALRLKNDQNEEVEIKKIIYSIMSKKETIREIHIPKKIVEKKAYTLKEILERIAVKQENEIREEARKANAGLFMGQEKFWEYDNFVAKTKLGAGKETGYRLENFVLETTDPIDAIKVSVIFTVKDAEQKETITIPVKQYEPKNEYIFPVKGSWLIFGNWDDMYNHRTMHSQEFAMDILQYNDDMTFSQLKDTPNESFQCYGAEVLAIADGEVVDCLNDIPENPNTPALLPNETLREIMKTYGFKAVASGNFVIIEHDNKEYSFYAHLQTGSVPVKQGDKVKQGQIIGKLGNSGNSTGPHLHFHLQNSSSILTGRGLPIRFTNITDLTKQKITRIQKDQSIVHSE